MDYYRLCNWCFWASEGWKSWSKGGLTNTLHTLQQCECRSSSAFWPRCARCLHQVKLHIWAHTVLDLCNKLCAEDKHISKPGPPPPPPPPLPMGSTFRTKQHLTMGRSG